MMTLLPNSQCLRGSGGFRTPEKRINLSVFRETSGFLLTSHKPETNAAYSQASNLNIGVGMTCGFLRYSRWISVSGCSRKSRMLCHAASSVRENAAVVAALNFYEVLGLNQDVALPDIKAAYRQMARRYHPDVCAPEEGEESSRRFIALREAYETLSDPRRKALYDRATNNHLYSFRGLSLNEEDPLNWKVRWEDQLVVLKKRSAAKGKENFESWGARMRRRRQHQEQQ